MRDPLFKPRIRTDSSYSRHDEDWFTFLDRVDDVVFARVRELMDEWFAALPEPSARDVRVWLRSGMVPQVEGAFWELYLHTVLVRSGFGVQRDVQTGDRDENVDFVVSDGRGSDRVFSTEAVAVLDPPRVRERARRLEAAWEVLNRETAAEFFVWFIRVEREGQRTPSGVKLKQSIIPWLSTLDRASVASGRLPERSLDVGDWRFRVRAVPVADLDAVAGKERLRLVGAQPIETGAGGSGDAIRKGLKRKRASKYDRLELPYAIALLDLHRFSGDDDVCAQLFGSEAVQVLSRGDEIVATRAIRKPDGYWKPTENTRVSAVLYARHLRPWCVTRVTPELWLNPWASRALEVDLPWATRISVDPEGHIVRTPATTHVSELMELDPGWPGPERPFQR